MPEPQITARRFTAIGQFNRLPCPWCQREALSTGDEDMIVGHVDQAHDALCPELARREREKAALVARLEELREAFHTATPKREPQPVDACHLAEKAKSIFDAMDAAAHQPDPPPVFTTRARAEAYEAWKREANATGWSEAIGKSIRQMTEQHAKHLDRMLEAMPVGYRLCVHAAEWATEDGGLFDVEADMTTLRLRQKVHLLAPGYACAARYGATQYGPKQ